MAINLAPYLQYIYAVLILIGALIVARILLWFINVVVKKATSKTKTELDDIILERIRMPIYYLAVLIGVSWALKPIAFAENVADIIGKVFYSIMIIFVAFIIVQAVGVFLTYWLKKKIANTKSTLDDELFPVFSKAINAVIYILALLYILGVWGIEITPLLAGLGIAGLAVALALKDTLENVFAGISIIGDRYFKVGDTIKLESGEVGNVTDIGLRSTKISTFDDEVIIVPNSQITTGRITNWAKPGRKARISLDIGVEYGSKPEKVKKVILDTVKQLAKKNKHIEIKNPEPAVYFTQMGDFSLTFSLKVWVDDYKQRYDTKDQLNEAIYNALGKAKIGIPFPTRTIYTKKG